MCGVRQLQTLIENNAVTVDKLIEAVIAKGNLLGINALNAAEQVVFLIADLDSEVAINGLIGYYDNSSGNHPREVVNALEQIGAIQSAELIGEANSQFPDSSPPHDRIERHNLLWSLDEESRERIEHICDAFMDYSDDLGGKYEGFVLANRDKLEQ